MCIFTRIFFLPYPLIPVARPRSVNKTKRRVCFFPWNSLPFFLPPLNAPSACTPCVRLAFFFLQNSPSLSISLSLPETAILGFSIINLVSTFILLNVGSARDRPPRPGVGSVGTALRVIESLSIEERSIDRALNWAWRHGGPWSTRQNSRCPSRLFYDFFYDFLSIISYSFGNLSRRG